MTRIWFNPKSEFSSHDDNFSTIKRSLADAENIVGSGASAPGAAGHNMGDLSEQNRWRRGAWGLGVVVNDRLS